MKTPSRTDRPSLGRTQALRALAEETVSLFHQLRATAAALYGEGEGSAARRGVLRGLARIGPQTVPQMARARPVSRQHVQVLVDSLREDGLVELVDNPAHKRSRLVRLTARGDALCREMNRAEDRVYADLGRKLPDENFEAASRALRSIRTALAKRDRSLTSTSQGRSRQ